MVFPDLQPPGFELRHLKKAVEDGIMRVGVDLVSVEGSKSRIATNAFSAYFATNATYVRNTRRLAGRFAERAVSKALGTDGRLGISFQI